jgi:hypothetical protein
MSAERCCAPSPSASCQATTIGLFPPERVLVDRLVPEFGDRLVEERAEHVRRQRVEFDLHESAMPRDEATGPAVGVFARLRREYY